MTVTWRTTTVVIVAGCVIALITFGMRTSFGLFTEPLSARARVGSRDVRARDRAAEPAVGPRPAVRGGGRRPLRRRAGARGRRRAVRAGHRADGPEHERGAVRADRRRAARLGLAGGSFTIVLAAFARLVPEDQRSWSMGLATAAGSLGQFLFAPLGQSFIAGYGPVTALLLLPGFVALCRCWRSR